MKISSPKSILTAGLLSFGLLLTNSQAQERPAAPKAPTGLRVVSVAPQAPAGVRVVSVTPQAPAGRQIAPPPAPVTPPHPPVIRIGYLPAPAKAAAPKPAAIAKVERPVAQPSR